MTLQNTCFDHWVKTYTKHFRLAIITPGGKAPALGKGWQTKASNNPDTVKAQAQNHPHCNNGTSLRASKSWPLCWSFRRRTWLDCTTYNGRRRRFLLV